MILESVAFRTIFFNFILPLFPIRMPQGALSQDGAPVCHGFDLWLLSMAVAARVDLVAEGTGVRPSKQRHYYCIHCVHSQREALINAPNHVHVRTCQRVTAQTSYVQFLMKVRLWYQVITQAFSHLWTQFWNFNLLQKRRKLTLLKQLSGCTKVLCPFHSSTKSSRWLTS